MNTMVDLIWALLAFFVLVMAASGVGRSLFQPFSARLLQHGNATILDVRLIQATIGLNLLAVATLLLSFGGVARAPFLLCLLLAGCAWWIVQMAIAIRHRPAKQDLRVGVPFLSSIRDFSVCSILGVISLGAALLPPESWDELVYHVELPSRWREIGSMQTYFDLPYSGFPSLSEAIFLLVSPIEASTAPRLICWAGWIAGLMMLYRSLQVVSGNWVASTLVAALAMSDVVMSIGTNCYVESIAMMQLAVMVRFMQIVGGSDDRNEKEVLPSSGLILGVLAGGAASIKLTNVPIAALAVLWLAISSVSEPSRTRPWRKACWTCVVVCAAFAGLFYLRPWLQTGNPFFPYLDQYFTDSVARVESSAFHHAIGNAFGVQGFLPSLMAPILLAFNQDVFDGSFGWQLLPILALATVGLSRRVSLRKSAQNTRAVDVHAARISNRSLQAAANQASRESEDSDSLQQASRTRLVVAVGCFAFAYLVFWCATSQQARFAIPAILCLLLPVADLLHRTSRFLRIGALLGINLLTTISIPWGMASYYTNAWLIDLGAMPRMASLDEATQYELQPLVAAIEKHTPQDAKVLLLFEHRGFLIPRKHRIGSPFFQSEVFTPSESWTTSKQIVDELSRLEVTHVVLSVVQSGPDFAEAWSGRLPPFLDALGAAVAENQLKVLWAEGRYKILVFQR